MVVGVLACCALLHTVCDLKTTHECATLSNFGTYAFQVLELMLYQFILCHNGVETSKNICCVKGEATFVHSTVTRWLKKFWSACKNLDDLAWLGRPIYLLGRLCFKSYRQICWVTPGEYQVSLVYHLHNLDKSYWSCGIVPCITKIWQNIGITLECAAYVLNFKKIGKFTFLQISINKRYKHNKDLLFLAM